MLGNLNIRLPLLLLTAAPAGMGRSGPRAAQQGLHGITQPLISAASTAPSPRWIR